MRTYRQALEYLNQFVNYERQRSAPYSAETLNLDRMRDLLNRLGNPHRAFPAIHIAGSKGKGSTAAMIESILRAAGYRTGLYTSPHLHTTRERMRVSGELIAPETFAALVDAIEPHAAAVAGITWFEMLTALGFLHFARSAIDVGVIEVGLGGRFDATNVVTPLVSVITSLSLDHMAWLGDTLAQIAFEKAGIIKPGVPVVSAPQMPDALAVIERITAERDAPLTVTGRDAPFERLALSLEGQAFQISVPAPSGSARPSDPALRDIELKIPFVGAHQITNAAVAVTAITIAGGRGLPAGVAAIQAGLLDARWPGRFEIARRDPPLIFDGAHNPDSAEKLAVALDEFFPDRRWTLIFGSSADKDIAAMLAALASRAERVIITRAKSARAADLEEIAERLSDRERPVEIAASVAEAMAQAIDAGAPVIVTGSLFVVAEAREAWLERAGLPLPDRDM